MTDSISNENLKLPEEVINRFSKLLPINIRYRLWRMFVLCLIKFSETKEIGIKYSIQYILRSQPKTLKEDAEEMVLTFIDLNLVIPHQLEFIFDCLQGMSDNKKEVEKLIENIKIIIISK